VSFELELLRFDKDGRETIIKREQCPLDLSLAQLKAQTILDEQRKRGGGVDAIRIRDSSGQEIFFYVDTAEPSRIAGSGAAA
jgi:hypothetical protein